MASDDIKPVRMEVIMATTHLIPGRDLRLTKEALDGLVTQFKPGPLHREHGERVVGRVLSDPVRQRSDGEWELVGEIEVDLPAGEEIENFLGKFMSIAFIEREADEPKTTVAIGLDSLAFDESDRGELREELSELSDVRVARYHQFAEVPPPAIAVDLANTIIPILQSAAGSAFWAALTFTVSHYVARKRAKVSALRFKLKGPRGVYLQAEVPANAKDAVAAVEALFEGAAKLIQESEGHENGGTATEPGDGD